MSGAIVAVQNYLVPANGKTGMYIFRETLVAGVEYKIDFREVNLDGQDFWPYGVYMDNKQGTAQLDMYLDQAFLTISAVLGGEKERMYPGTADQSVTITGEGPVTICFVNFPIV